MLAPEFQPSPAPVILPRVLTILSNSPKKCNAQKSSIIQTLTPPNSLLVDLTTTDTGSNFNSEVESFPRSSSYRRKRARNNESCRVSRKKKKTVRSEAEEKLHFLTEDNDAMRIKIAELEKKVKETRAILLCQMTGKSP